MEASWYDGSTEITDSSQGEYSARKLQLGDILKLIILRDERLIVLRWCWGSFVSFAQVWAPFIKSLTVCSLTVDDLSSGYGVTAYALAQGSTTTGSTVLTVDSPAADKTYTCRVKPASQADDTASNTDVKLNVYGTCLYCLKHLHNFKP